MGTYEQITLDQWVQWKEDIRRKLAETAQNFVHIGYRLRQIRDSGMYGGAADIFEFAEREYGLGKSTVSRFIAINERYSEGGDSLELREEYRAFSSSKLSEMLTLPDNELQLVTERTTIREIRELKEFNRQEAPGDAGTAGVRQDTGEEPPGGRQDAGRAAGGSPSPVERCILDFFRDKREVLEGIMGMLGEDPPGYRGAMEAMNPSGQASHRKGTVFLFLYDWATGVKYKVLAQPEPVCMAWPGFLDMVYRLYGAGESRDVWADFYGTPDPPVATSQREDGTGENRVAETGPAGGTPAAGMGEAPDAGKAHPAAAVQGEGYPAEEEQLPGQMDVYDYPELIPGETGKGTDGAEETGTGEYPATDGGTGSRAGTDDGGQEPGNAQGATEAEGGLADNPQEHAALHGTAADGGCEADPGGDGCPGAEDAAWKEVRESLYEIRAYTVSRWGRERGIGTAQVQELYGKAVDLAAALERIMMIRSRENGQEHHAQ